MTTQIRRLTEGDGVELLDDVPAQRLRLRVRRDVVAFLADLADPSRIDRGAGTVAFNAALPYPAGSVGAILRSILTGVGEGTPYENIEALVAQLAGLLGPDQLTADLRDRIDLIDADGTGLVDVVDGLVTTFGSTTAAASSAAAAAASQAVAVDAAVNAAAARDVATVRAGEALTQAEASEASRVAAQTAAGNASTSANSAATAATSAAGSLSSATTQAALAAAASSTAGTSAAAAATSATTAQSAATNASNSATAANTSRLEAQSSAGAASNSATSAAGSATSASGAASFASTQATLASQAAVSADDSAESSAISALSAATSATSASSSATTAGANAAAANSSRISAETAAATASVSSGSAAGSATSASGSASAAAAHYNNTVAATGALTASVSSLSTAVAGPEGLSAQYVLKVATTRIDGKKVFAAIGLASQATGAAGESQLLFQADKLLFVPPGAPNDVPVQFFSVGYVDGVLTLIVPAARIGDSSIGPGKMAVSALSAITANVGELTAGVIRNAADTYRVDVTNGRTIVRTGAAMKVTGAPFGSASQFIEWYGPYFANLASCTEANATFYLKTNGASYFGGGLSAGVLRNAAQGTALANDASVVVGPFGTNGGAKTYTLSYVFQRRAVILDAPSWSGTASAVLVLEKWNGSSWVALTTLNASGVITEANAGSGPFEPGGLSEEISGSTTFVDNTAGAGTVHLRGRLVSRTQFTFLSTGDGSPDVISQNISVLSIE